LLHGKPRPRGPRQGSLYFIFYVKHGFYGHYFIDVTIFSVWL